MPRGYPNDPANARSRGSGGYRLPLDRNTIKERLKEIEEQHKERVRAMHLHMKRIERREKAINELKNWLTKRKLEIADLLWMAGQLRPKRADKPVKSKLPLQPTRQPPGSRFIMSDGKLIAPKGDPEFRRRILEARKAKGWNSEAVGKKLGVSPATISSWEAGRYVPKEEMRVKLLKVLELPAGLGAEATKQMEASMVTNRGNGRA